MKRILILTILLMSSLAWAGSTTVVVGQGGGAPVAFCSGSELFCEDFEGTDTSWDTETGATLDCDGYDAGGDYCDDETTTYKSGSESFGIRGANTVYVSEALSTTATECYFELWQRWTDVTKADGVKLVSSGGNSVVFINCTSTPIVRIYTKGGSTYVNTNVTPVVDTWYHIGVYWKQETRDEANDGIVRCWVNTDGGTFDAADLVGSSTTVDTGTTSYVVHSIRLQAPTASGIAYYDDCKVVAGAPAWAYE